MRRNGFLTFLKEKRFLIVLTLMLVSAGTMAVLFTFGEKEQTESTKQAKQVEIQTETFLVEEAQEDVKLPESEVAKVLPKTTVIKRTTENQDNILENEASNTQNAVLEAELEDQFLEAEEMAEVSTTDVVAEGFSEQPVLQHNMRKHKKRRLI